MRKDRRAYEIWDATGRLEQFFLHISPLSNLTSSTSLPPDPTAALASNCVRDYFGPIVQTVADALQARGTSTLQELVAHVRRHCSRDWNEERGRLVERLNRAAGRGATVSPEVHYRGGRVRMNKARGSDSAGFVTDAPHMRAALIVLLHHSLVKISGGRGGGGKDPDKDANQAPDPTSPHAHYRYTFLPDRARLLPRYSRYVEHVRDAVDENAARLVECLLANGRMEGEEAIFSAWGVATGKSLSKELGELEDTDDDDEDDDSDSNKVLKDIVQCFTTLVQGGYVEMVTPITSNRDYLVSQKQKQKQDGIHGGEYEFGMDEDGKIAGSKTRSLSDASNDGDASKKRKRLHGGDARDDGGAGAGAPHHPKVLALLAPRRKLVPVGSVYRVNTAMFHTSLRGRALGRLVAEMYPGAPAEKKAAPQKAQGADGTEEHVGAVVAAALAFAAQQEHAPVDRLDGADESEEDRHRRMAEWGTFAPAEIAPYLPPDVTKALKASVGGLRQNLSALLVRLCELRYPPVVLEVEDALGHPQGGKFEICARQLLQRMRDRVVHRVLASHHGLTSARIVSILQMRGHVDSDAVAEDALVPAKEAREVLHRLHRDGYINAFDMHMTKTHNSGTAIYLWDVMPARLLKTVKNNVCTALLNLRLRRQHEVEVGKDWMDRAKEAGATEENVHVEDKKKYLAFCKGLERLDCACLQLDETLSVIADL